MSYNNIVILGGGTAGWSAAAILSTNSKRNITVIESLEIGTIGVGESTLPYLNIAHSKTGFLKFFLRNKWLDEVEGTAKFSIEFADFYKLGEKWIHPFFSVLPQDNEKRNSILLKKLYLKPEQPTQKDLVKENFLLAQFKEKKFYDTNSFAELNESIQFGYHINAKKYADLLSEESLKRGNVTRKIGTVVDVIVNSQTGYIESLTLDTRESITADLFIDCTGFSRILSNNVGSSWVDKSDRMWCDNALTVQLPYSNTELQQKNTTYCHALKNGWVWSVPLQTRIGTGYVFSSRYTTRADAEIEFKQHLSSRYGYNVDNIEFRLVPFQTGYLNEAWNKNVVAIGLSSSFIEPIESTAIALLQSQSLLLNDLLYSTHLNELQKKNIFNDLHKNHVEDILNFTELHYTLSERTDSQFWIDYSNKTLNDYQKFILETYLNPQKVFTSNTLKTFRKKEPIIFNVPSYSLMFLGYGINPNTLSHRKLNNSN